jgi:acyl carrier protein
MNRIEIERLLIRYLAEEKLDGDESQLTNTTPLLAWGILDSLGVVELTAFIQSRLGVAIPADDVTAENMESVAAVAALVMRLGASELDQAAA